MSRLCRAAVYVALLAAAAATLVELDPTDPADQRAIMAKLEGCGFDLIVDVRSQVRKTPSWPRS
jgi:hypothetical protein